MRRPLVLVTGASPDGLNRNTALRDYVAEGFRALLGSDQVANIPLEFASERVASTRPDLVLAFGSCLPDESDFGDLEHATHRHKGTLAFWLHDDPYEFDAHAKIVDLADHVFSNDRWAARHYDRPNVWHLPMAASPTAHRSAGGGDFLRDVFFCGVGFANRRRLLSDLGSTLAGVCTEVYGDEWDESYPSFCRNERLPNSALASFYASSRIVLSMGRDHHYANRRYGLAPSSPGPRTFEAAMAGACQMHFVESLEILDYFELDKEIVLFDDPKDFEAKLSALLSDPQKAQRIGSAAQARCMRDHTYEHRSRTLLETVGLS